VTLATQTGLGFVKADAHDAPGASATWIGTEGLNVYPKASLAGASGERRLGRIPSGVPHVRLSLEPGFLGISY